MNPDFKRIERADDPDRCQHVINGKYQCGNKAAQGGKFCQAHSSPLSALGNYRLSKVRGRLDEKSTAANIKSLREEVGLLRLLLEERINYCKDDIDFMMAAPEIGSLVTKIQSAVLSCQHLDEKIGNMLDREAVMEYTNTVIGVISKYVDKETLAKIVEEL